MNRLTLSILLAAALALPSFAGKPALGLTKIGECDNGLDDDFAEIISVSERNEVAAITIPVETEINGVECSGLVDILRISNPALPQFLRRLCINADLGAPTSVAVHPTKNFLLVAVGEAGKRGHLLAYRLTDGKLLDDAPIGIQPDSVIISHDGDYAIVANEAEGADEGDNGGEGSISLVNLKFFFPAFPSALWVTNIPLPSAAGVPGFSTGLFDAIAFLPIDNTPGTLEPESIAFSPDDKFAFITLQENNGVAVLNLRTRVIRYIGLGKTSHLADTTDGKDGVVSFTDQLNLFREPDGVGVFEKKRGGRGSDRWWDGEDLEDLYFVTADEGDTVLSADGDEGPRGGRTISIFNAKTGKLVGDTGNQLDAAAHAAGKYDDGRSDRGGSEPEVLDVAEYKGRTLVAVGLERSASVALVDVTDPESPKVLELGEVGARPEGVKFYEDCGKLYLFVANEEGGPTVSVFRVD